MLEKMIKGGKKKMETTQDIVYKDICPYCSKEIKSLYPKQLRSMMESHKSACSDNPSNKENVKN